MALHKRRNYYICSPIDEVALWLEHRIHNPEVGSSSLLPATKAISNYWWLFLCLCLPFTFYIL